MVVTREPEFDRLSQAKILAALELRDELCPCGCGQPMDAAHDPQTVAVVEKFTCAYRRAIEQVERADRKKHENNPEKLDGVFWYARPHDPELDRGKPAAKQPTEPNRTDDAARSGRMSSRR